MIHAENIASPYRATKLQSFFLLIISILVPVVFLLVCELALRVFGYGYDPGFFVKESINGKDFYVRNYKFSWRFFPKPMARLSAPLKVPAEKSPDVIRVFVLGSSAAMGDPEPTFGFSRMLEVMLQKKYPGKKIEIFNTAATAINSNVILPIARDCLELNPDLFVIYSGNNEVVGPFGLSAALTPFFSSRTVIKAQVWLGCTRMGQLLKSFNRKKAASTEEWKGMELFVEHKIRHADPNLEKIYSHFKDNLAEICNLAEKRGIKVILSTVIVNESDCAPFVSMHNPALDSASLVKWESLFREAQAHASSGRHREACDAFLKAAAIDGDYAELQFRLGRCYQHLNLPKEARESFQKSLAFDALRFRADSRLNQIIRDVASDNSSRGVSLVDAEACAREKTTNGTPGANLLYEHVHLNFNGNYLLATCVLRQLEKVLLLQGTAGEPDVSECKKRLAYTVFDEKRIEERLLSRLQAPPFTSQCSNSEDLQRLRTELVALEASCRTAASNAESDYRNAIAARPDDWQIRMNFLKYLYDLHYYPQAYEQAQLILAQIPSEYFSLMNMGVTLQKLKKFGEAEGYLSKAIQANPYLTEAYEKMGLLWEERKDFAKAEHYLKKRNSPGALAAFYNRAGLHHAKEEQVEAAKRYFGEALAIKPDFAEAQDNLNHCISNDLQVFKAVAFPENSENFKEANLCLKQGNLGKAIDLYFKVVADYPTFCRARNNLGFALVRANRYDEAMEQFTKASQISPESTEAYQNMASLLGIQGKHAEAIQMLRKAVALNPTPQLNQFLGEEYRKTGNIVEADEFFEKARLATNASPKRQPHK